MEFQPNTSCSSSSSFYSPDNSDIYHPEIAKIIKDQDGCSKLCKNPEKIEIRLIDNIHQAGLEGRNIVNEKIGKDLYEGNSFNSGFHKGRDINQIHYSSIQKIKKGRRRRSIETRDISALRKQKRTKSLNSHCYSMEKKTNIWFQNILFQSKRMLEEGKELLQNSSINPSYEQQMENCQKEPHNFVQSLTEDDVNQLKKRLIHFSSNAKKICLNYHLQKFQDVLSFSCHEVELVEAFGDELDWTYWMHYLMDPLIFPNLKVIKCKTKNSQMFQNPKMANLDQFAFESHGFHFIVLLERSKFQ